MAGFLLAAAAVAVTGWLVVACLRLRGAAAVVGWWVVVCAELVAAAEILSLAHGIRPLEYALVEGVLLAGALVAWQLTGRPRPGRPNARGLPSRIGSFVRSQPLLAILGLAVVLGVGYELFVVVATPPNNWDSMHYHLSRVAAWRAQRSLAYFPTHNGIENAYPQNAELLVLWTMVFLGRDVVAALPQLLAGLTTTASVYLIARRIGHDARSAAFAALLFPTLAIVALESVTTQNDLVEASFVAAAVALALGRTRGEAALAGLALGLAAGTKLTFLYAVPPVVVIGLLGLPRRRLAAVSAAAVVGFVLVGMYAYVQNIAETGRPQGRAAQVESMPPVVTLPGTASTVARTAYRLIDVSGFHVRTPILEHVSGAAKRVFDALHIPPDPPESTTQGTFAFAYEVTNGTSEDSSAFGPLGFLLLVPLSVGYLVAWAIGRTDRVRGALALTLPLYILALALGTRWNFYVERFLITPMALTLPLAPAVLRPWWLRAVVLAVAGVTLATSLVYDPSKPTGVGGGVPVWDRTRLDVETIRRSGLLPVLEAVNRRVPADARLGIDLGPLDWEYPLWGARLSRRLVWLPEQSSAGLRWVVLGQGFHARPPGRWCPRHFPSSGWTLLRRC